MNKLSSSSVRMYSECSKRYKLHYIDRLRPRTTNGAFLFGLAVDHALNYLLKNPKDLSGAIQIFEASWDQQVVNGKMTLLKTAHDIVYAAKDFDGDLLTEEDHNEFHEYYSPLFRRGETSDQVIKFLKDLKAEKGYENLSNEEKELYAVGHWLCLRRKGHIMLKSYSEKVLPRIKEVHAVQKNFNMTNSEGDSLIGYLDLIATLDDGKRYLLDNKTSSSLYTWDSPMRSQQLILYYHAEKEEYNLDGVGFIVLYKHMIKNKTKICISCKTDGSAGRHKTCAAIDLNSGKRCNGEFIETINPECNIDVLLNYVPESAENLVLETFDRANEGIKKEVFAPNLFACGDSNSDYKCAYYNLCWKNNKKDLIELDKKE